MIGSTKAWAWHHTGFAVTDLDHALTFYRDTLGFEVVFLARGMSEPIQSITGIAGLQADLAQCRSLMSGQLLEFIEFRNVPVNCDPMMPVWPGRAHTAYLVADLEHAVASLVSAGGVMLGQITEFAEGRAVYCADRTGAVVELEESVQGFLQ